ncbi:MAG: glutamine--fructose-6-phosphate transaminase (isomerizing) [Clostridia bacterium]|nr:glutamine--fructose-6-phosphate transaminase (isomerizing) [Clostridia bacterium]
MCGIIGYIGAKNTVNLLLEGLKNLEYRGYDSSGIATILNYRLDIKKAEGELANLKELVLNSQTSATIGIGHTRWATHGVPSLENAHPHTNTEETIAVVHNGIIENYLDLKKHLIEKGYSFKSETDTEVIPHLIDMYYDGDLLESVKKAVSELDGSYAIGVISLKEPDKIIAVRKDSPLIVGLHSDGNFIASDIPAIISKTRNIYLLDDNEFVSVSKDNVQIEDFDGNEIKKEIFTVNFSAQESQKDGYEHFMLKEIFEQPEAIKRTLCGHLDSSLNLNLNDIKFENYIDKFYIVACGTAFHAGLVGKKVIETLAQIPCEVLYASEFRYNHPIITPNTAVWVVSQSGETADTLACLRMAKKLGNTVYAITNVVGSSISREADFVFYTNAGPEISVASTKAYTTQLIAFYLLAIHLAELKNNKDTTGLKKQLLAMPDTVETVLKANNDIKLLARKIAKEHDVFFLGRGIDYFVAQEASLKLKEISYIHSEAYASGELKHGPIALIEDGTVVISLCNNPEIASKLKSNVEEVSARGAYTIGFTSCLDDVSAFNEHISLPSVNNLLSPLVSIIPLQLLAYYVCTEKGFDVDKPRNLAKSVTVE